MGSSRNDMVIYMIFAYLSFFRLEELAIEDYKKLIMSQDALKMHTFLQFVFDVDVLRENVRDAWMELYDYQYIDEKIIGGIEKSVPNVSDILRTLERKATGKVSSSLSQSGKSTDRDSESQSMMTSNNHQSMNAFGDESEMPKKITVQEPFNLTKPKPKVIPQPEALQREVKANPVPKGLFNKTGVQIEKDKEERRKIKTDAIRR